VPEVDKAHIRSLLTKPFNMYILRHSGLTEKSTMVKEHVLRNYAGWSLSSTMPQRYIHYFGSESSKSILKIKGVIKENEIWEQNVLKSKQCPNCFEPNKQLNRFCVKCKMVLSYDSYNEARNEDLHKIEKLEIEIDYLKEGMNKIFLLIQQNPILSQVKPEKLQGVLN
jgi:hypothetical protein